MSTELLTIDEALDIAFEIFEEMADDNLEMDDLNAFHTHFDSHGAVMAVSPKNDWIEYIGSDIDINHFIEVHIGFAAENSNELNNIIARVLLNQQAEKKECYIQWKRKNGS